jgi:hypothetical protein
VSVVVDCVSNECKGKDWCERWVRLTRREVQTGGGFYGDALGVEIARASITIGKGK